MIDKPLRICHWNAQSLAKKKKLLAHFLREQNIDVMLISETFLRESEQFNMSNYCTYRKDEKRSDGAAYRGLAVLVKRNVVHQSIPYKEFQSLNVLGILAHVGGRNLRIFAAYRPHGFPTGTMERDLEELLSTSTRLS